jgi:hypothetical protein
MYYWEVPVDSVVTFQFLLEVGHKRQVTDIYGYMVGVPIPMAALSKAWFCGRSLAGIVGANPAGGMDVCLL